MNSISSAALKRGGQRMSIERRKTKGWEILREKNPWGGIMGFTNTCKYKNREIETGKWCWNGSGSMAGMCTVVERILGVENRVWRCQKMLKRRWIDGMDVYCRWADSWSWIWSLTMSKGAETLVDRWHGCVVSLSGFLELKIGSDDVKRCWNVGGSMAGMCTVVERILGVENEVWRALRAKILRNCSHL